jgi:uncharacterized protein YabE (DUF348 family)
LSIRQTAWPEPAHRPNPLQRLLSNGLFAIGTLVAVFGLMMFGYATTLAQVTIVVDGQPRQVRTNQRTVESVLREAGLALAPEDFVVPDLSTTLPEQSSTITVQHARSVTVVADGQSSHFRTHVAAPPEILQEAGVAVGPHDLVMVNLDTGAAPLISNGPVDLTPLTLVVRRAIPITIDLGKGHVRRIETPAKTVGQALTEANIQLYLADRIQPDLYAPLTSGMRILIEPSSPVQIEVDGQIVRTRTLRSTVADVLADMDVRLFGQDYTQPALDAAIEPNAVIQVVRVREELAIVQEPILFETQQEFDPNLELDTSTTQEGKNGVRQKRIRVRYENDQEIARNVEDDFVLQPPINRVVRYGTKVVVRTLDTPNGPIEYWRHLRMYATSYSAATSGTPKSAPWYGRTATGATMRKGIVAVDPTVVRLGWKLYVPNYGIGLAADTGGGVKGRWLDLGYDDNNLEVWHWWVDAYLLTPAPPANSIPYSIPNWPTFSGR